MATQPMGSQVSKMGITCHQGWADSLEGLLLDAGLMQIDAGWVGHFSKMWGPGKLNKSKLQTNLILFS